jgi:hypothetical protein
MEVSDQLEQSCLTEFPQFKFKVISTAAMRIPQAHLLL